MGRPTQHSRVVLVALEHMTGWLCYVKGLSSENRRQKATHVIHLWYICTHRNYEILGEHSLHVEFYFSKKWWVKNCALLKTVCHNYHAIIWCVCHSFFDAFGAEQYIHKTIIQCTKPYSLMDLNTGCCSNTLPTESSRSIHTSINTLLWHVM